MKVHEILDSKGTAVVTSRPESSVAEVARLLVEHRVGSAVIIDSDHQIMGIVSERDIVRGIAVRGAESVSMAVEAIMADEIAYCAPEDAVSDVMRAMTERRVRHMPVIDEGELAGIISIGDVVKCRIEETETEANILRDYITAR